VVEIEVTLRNDGTVPLQVTSHVEGATRIAAATRGGVPVALVTARLDPEQDLDETLEAGLTTLAPGASLTGVLRTRSDSMVGGQALSVVRPGAPVEEDVLDVSVAGTYEVTLTYDYDGPVPPGAPVFTAATAPATASFTVTP
jgi:hypothetical protein